MMGCKFEPSLEPRETTMLRCPVCGDEINRDDKVICDLNGVVIGCQWCLDIKYAEDVLE